jgi:hypothetical protein
MVTSNILCFEKVMKKIIIFRVGENVEKNI